MIKVLLILGLISGFGLMFLGVIALFSNYAEILFPMYVPFIIIACGVLIFFRTLYHINKQEI
tara:strand:+ start:537 stop:722 length:186 start_codon:yes stop_codon:yes gene_type:complete